MKNRNYIILLVFSLLLLPFTVQWVNIDNTIASKPINNTINYSIESFTQEFSGTYEAKAFVGPDNVFDVVNESIHMAVDTLYLEVYTLSSEALINSLIYAKVTNGVDVVILLEEDHVSGYEDDYNHEAAYRLDAAGIEVKWTTTEYAFTHAKFWIVDEQYTYVYSGNWAPSSMPVDTDARENREMGLMFKDSAKNGPIATFYGDIFWEDYAKATSYAGTEPHEGILPLESSGTYVPVQVDPLSINEYMIIVPVFSPNNSYSALSNLINNATVSIDLHQQYVTDTCDLLPNLLAAADRGVNVRVMYPEPTSASKNVTELLIQHGIQVRYFKSLYDHDKYINVDEEYVSVSSINWSNGSVWDNREAGAIVKNTKINAYFDKVFEYDWENYTEIPTGFTPVVDMITPTKGIIADGIYEAEVGFYVGTFTTGELSLDGDLIKSWTNPSGDLTFNIDTTAFSDGVHTLTVKGITSTNTYTDSVKFNIINDDDWKLLITEVRWDAASEPGGEYFELYNGFDFDVIINNWKITDGEDTYIISSEDDEIFSDGGILIFVRDETTYTTEMTDLSADFYEPDYIYTSLQLGNTGDELILLSAEDEPLDVVVWGEGSYSSVTAWTGDMDDTMSLHRDPADVDTDDCSADFDAYEPDPGTVYITGSTSPASSTEPFSGFLIIPGIFAIATVTLVIYKKRK